MIFHFNNKVEREKLKATLVDCSQRGMKVGATSGSFDVLIARHALSLEECRKRCDVLIVFLNSDISIKKYKGPNRPVNTLSERSYMMSVLKPVEHVVIFDDMTPVALVAELQPDIYFNLSEWGKDCIEKHILDSYGGELCIFDVDLPNDWSPSTTNTIKRINEIDSKRDAKAIFIDRDGVINDNKRGYTYKWEDFEFLPGVLEALKIVSDSEYKLIIVTNQSGVGRGMYTTEDVERLHKQIIEFLSEKNIRVDAIHYCPHHPDDGCDCRKPGVRLFLDAVDKFGVNLSKSYMIGDKALDIEAGRMANVKTILVGTEDLSTAKIKPHISTKNLLTAVKRIFK